MKLYTIGFTKKSAEEFFSLLLNNNVQTVIDIRLNNSSQLAGFAKGRDLKYFLKEIVNAEYIEEILFAPTKEILDDYKNKKIDWYKYEVEYIKLLDDRKIHEYVQEKFSSNFDNVCLLCSEDKADYCHRRLASEYIKKVISNENIEIVHL